MICTVNIYDFFIAGQFAVSSREDKCRPDNRVIPVKGKYKMPYDNPQKIAVLIVAGFVADRIFTDP